MKTFTKGHLKAGINLVRAAKLRNFWTMFGVIIGVSSVITVVSIGEGIKAQISGQIQQTGKDLITIRPETINSGTGFTTSNAALLSGSTVGSSMTQADINTVSSVHGVAEVAPLTAVAGDASGERGEYKGGLVLGTTPALAGLLKASVAYGSFLTDESVGMNTAILGSNAAQKLFNENVPLGRTFTFRGQQFLVAGIMNDFNSTPLSEQEGFNNAIFIPNDVAESISNNTAPTFEILVKPTTPSSTNAVAKTINAALDTSHGGASGLSVLDQDQNLQSSSSVLDLLTRLIAAVAAISLLVGGIGIMNVMLVSVAERMHEIGIRKAVGATNGQILSQFMVEATVLSTTGGLIGIAIAGLVDLGLRAGTNIRPEITWQIVVIATGVSVAVGIIFGSIPALRAARKDPIEALRSD